MKNKTLTLNLLCFLLIYSTAVFSQKTATINSLEGNSPIIDGALDEIWNNIPSYEIKTQFMGQSVSYTVSPTYRATWDKENLYILITAPDDDFYPASESGTASWLSDKPEIYLDINNELLDGGGPSNDPGHFQIAPAYTDEALNFEYAYGFFNNDVENADAYMVEYKIPIEMLVNENNETWNPETKPTIGFDITLIDLDEANKGQNDGINGRPATQRVTWNNNGNIDESWNNMDYAGNLTFIKTEEKIPTIFATDSILFGQVAVQTPKTMNLAVKNTGNDTLTISNLQFNNAAFSTISENIKIAPNQKTYISVTFKPTETADYIGILSIHSNDPNSPVHNVSLIGSGITPPQVSLSSNTIEINDGKVGYIAQSSYIVNATNLVGDLLIKAPTGFSLSLNKDNNFTSNLIVRQINGSVDSTIIYVNFEPSINQQYIDTISHLTQGLSSVNLAITGNIVAAKAMLVSTKTKDGVYSHGKIIDIFVQYDDTVFVDTAAGKPQIELNITPSTKAIYNSGSGSKQLVFNYTIGETDSVTVLDYQTDAIILNGARLYYRDKEVSKALPYPSTFALNHTILIENTKPNVMLVKADTNSFDSVNQVTIILSEPAVDLSLNSFTLNNAVASNLKATDSSQLIYTLDLIGIKTGAYSILLDADKINDLAGNGNNASNKLTYYLDNEAPRILNLSINSITSNSAIASFFTDEIGLAYYSLAKKGTEIPTKTQLIEQSFSAAITDGQINIQPNFENSISLSRLEQGMEYTFYIATMDTLGNQSAIQNIDFTTLTVGINQNTFTNIKLYPNPNTGIFYIEFNEHTIVNSTMEIYDLSGALINKIQLTSLKQQIALPELKQGYYLLFYHTTKGIQSSKFLVK